MHKTVEIKLVVCDKNEDFLPMGTVHAVMWKQTAMWKQSKKYKFSMVSFLLSD